MSSNDMTIDLCKGVIILSLSYSLTEGFLTPFAFHSNSLANWGSSGVSIEVKFHLVFNFLDFVCHSSARIE